VEVVVVIATIVMLFFLMLPVIQMFREAHCRTQTVGHLTQLGKATHNFAGTYDKKLPYNGKPADGALPNDKSGSIFFHLLRFVNQDSIYRDANTLIEPTFTTPQDFTAPFSGRTSDGLGIISFAGNATLFNSGIVLRLPKDFAPAGTSNVVMFGTARAVCGDTERAWSTLSAFAPPAEDGPVTGTVTCYQSSNAAYTGVITITPNVAVPLPQSSDIAAADCNDSRLQVFGGGAAHVCMGDGSVRGVSTSMSIPTWSVVNSPKSTIPPPSDWLE
jgi:hypothetical protein